MGGQVEIEPREAFVEAFCISMGNDDKPEPGDAVTFVVTPRQVLKATWLGTVDGPAALFRAMQDMAEMVKDGE